MRGVRSSACVHIALIHVWQVHATPLHSDVVVLFHIRRSVWPTLKLDAATDRFTCTSDVATIHDFLTELKRCPDWNNVRCSFSILNRFVRCAVHTLRELTIPEIAAQSSSSL